MGTVRIVSLEYLFAHYDLVRRLLAALYGPRGADMILVGLRLQAFYGECFASSHYLGSPAANELARANAATYGRADVWGGDDAEVDERRRRRAKMAWLRLTPRLRAAGHITERRRIRPNGRLAGTRGTNVTDFSALWREIMQIVSDVLRRAAPWVRSATVQVAAHAGTLYVKIAGIWGPVERRGKGAT